MDRGIGRFNAMRRHKWVENVCSACGLIRRREYTAGRTLCWSYVRGGKTYSQGGNCPGKPDVKEGAP